MIDLTEKVRPRSKKELVGNQKAIETLEGCILHKKVCLLYGPPGVGKTSSVYAIAEEHNLKVREYNASDERRREELYNVLRVISSHLLVPTVFLMDEIDGIESFSMLEKIIKSARHPLVLIANDLYRIPKVIQDLCKKIRFYHPKLSEVNVRIRQIAEKTGMKADYSKISHDIRSSIYNAFYGGERYDDKTNFDNLNKFFKTGDPSGLVRDDEIWLLDNAINFLYGKQLYLFYRLLAISSEVGKFVPLSFIKNARGEVKYPRYLKRIKVMRNAKKK